MEPNASSASGRLYLQVLLGIVLGGLLGYFNPSLGVACKPLGDGFISLIKMLIGPVVFCTVVLGIAGMSDLKKVGRVGAKSLLYFELVSTLALILGMLIANGMRPGHGFNVNPATLDAGAVADYAKKASGEGVADFLLHTVPKTFADAFTAGGDILQVLLVSVLFGFALATSGEKGRPVVVLMESFSHACFAMVNIVMRFAPFGAGGAMAFTIGKYGAASLLRLLNLMAAFYLTCICFVVLVLGSIARATGFSIFRFIAYIKEEMLTVLGTSSSEVALVPLMQKLEQLGCSRSVVGLVVPAGYSFNLDGTNIYLTMGALFVAQALNIDLTLAQQLKLLGVATLTSKGASAVTGAGFVALAATLAVVPSVPVSGLALILGIDRFMSEARSLTNLVGNGVATIVVSRWEGELDAGKLREELGR
ncbi:MAG: dicarboxylate/amino acid:cation symporter [Candidatus Wallbacteria bacterium]|nr:dicarboxylate/amino acid:cation symporter [Candidatus Wallbacteria bacterium]